MQVEQGQPQERTVERQLARLGIRDPAVTSAIRYVPRERFLPAELAALAHDDTRLGMTARPPIVESDVALLADALELGPDDKVLEIGTGSGYMAAVLAELAREVFTVERQITLCRLARERVHELGYRNIHIRCCDGTTGWAEEAPFDAILVHVGSAAMAQALRTQLAVGGRLVIPVGTDGASRLLRVWRIDDTTFEQEDSV